MGKEDEYESRRMIFEGKIRLAERERQKGGESRCIKQLIKFNWKIVSAVKRQAFLLTSFLTTGLTKT